jgi:hypothetical protein
VSECITSLKILSQDKTTKITFNNARGTQEKTILVETKVSKKGLGNKPVLQHACSSLNEGNQGIFLPSKTTPMLAGQRKQANKHKPKRYGKASLICFCCKKKG